jgi:hypothetical protein
MSNKLPARRRLLKSWAAITVIWWVFAMGIVANKGRWELGPEWCAEYMLVKYMLYMEDGWCSSAASELPTTGVQLNSQAGRTLSERLRVRFETMKLLDL